MEKKKRFITVDIIFGESFNLYFKNIIQLSIPVIIAFSLFGVFFYQYFQYVFEMASGDMNMSELYSYMALMMLASLIFYIVMYMEIKIISNAYIDKSESLLDILKESLRRFFPFLWMHILFTLGIWVAMLLLVVPAYILMIGWSVFQVIFIVENGRAAASLKRSWKLTKGNKGRIFLIFLLSFSAIYFFMIIIMLIAGGVLSGMTSRLEQLQTPEFVDSLTLILTIVMMVLYSLLYPLFTTFITIIYYNLIKEKEGFETAILADSFLEEKSVDENN